MHRAGVLRCFAFCLLVIGPLTCVATQPASDDEGSLLSQAMQERDPAPSTIFRWTLSEEDPESADDRLVTDRPHFSEASSLVGLGRVQLETGYTFFSDSQLGVTTQTHSFPEPLLRAGVFADWFEFRLAYNYLVQRQGSPSLADTVFGGSDDLYVAAKIALAKQAGFCPEVAFFPQLRVPSGSPAFSAGEVLPGFNLAYSWKINDLLELECNTQVNRRLDDADHFYTQVIQTANLEYDLSESVGAFTEWFAFFPSGSLVALPEHYLHGGFVFFPSDNVQLDVHVGMGANPAADDLAFTGAGFSIRY